MDFIGKWINQESNDLIEISNISGDDKFRLNYGSDLKESDDIEIFLSEPKTKHARLLNCKKFKTHDIFILSSDSTTDALNISH